MGVFKMVQIDRINTWVDRVENGGVAIMPSSLVEDVTAQVRTHLPGAAFNIDTSGNHSYVSMVRSPYVRLDADNEGHFYMVLEQRFKHVMDQLVAQQAIVQELYEDLEDVERLRKLMALEQVLPQDIETLDLMEQEMEELYGDI